MPFSSFYARASESSGIAAQNANERLPVDLLPCADSDEHFVLISCTADEVLHANVIHVTDADTIEIGPNSTAADFTEWAYDVGTPVPGTAKFILSGYALSGGDGSPRYRVVTRSGMSVSFGPLQVTQRDPLTDDPEWLYQQAGPWTIVALSSSLVFTTAGRMVDNSMDPTVPPGSEVSGTCWRTYSFNGSSLSLVNYGAVPDDAYSVGPPTYNSLNSDAHNNAEFGYFTGHGRRIDSERAVYHTSFAGSGQQFGGGTIVKVTDGGSTVQFGTRLDMPRPGSGAPNLIVDDVLSNGKLWLRRPNVGYSTLQLVPYTFSDLTLVAGTPVAFSQEPGNHFTNVWVSGDDQHLMTVMGNGSTPSSLSANLTTGAVEVFSTGQGLSDRDLASYGETPPHLFSQPIPGLDDCLLVVSVDLSQVEVWSLSPGPDPPPDPYPDPPTPPSLSDGAERLSADGAGGRVRISTRRRQ